MAASRSLKLNDGRNMPIVGLGTWQSKAGEVIQAVKDAIDAGYRHIDTAFIYQNEEEVGTGLKAKFDDGTIKREDVFITSKVWNTFHSKDKVFECLNLSLKKLGLAYLDLYLIHWPVGYQEGGELIPKHEDGMSMLSDVDFMETWQAMEEAQKQGLVRSIGVSNFNKEQIERILAEGNVPPAVNQVECHPYLNQSKLFEFCKSKDIVLTAYSPLGSPQRPWAKPEDPVILEDPRVVAIAQKYKKSTAQVLIKFQVQRGIVCIPKSVTKSRIIENFQIWDFELAEEDMDTIKSIDCNGRALVVPWMSKSKYYPFNAEY